MAIKTKQVTVFAQTVDSSEGPQSIQLCLARPLSSGTFTLSYSELPCKCAPTMVCIPTVASLELAWSNFDGNALGIKRGTLSFERRGGTSRRVSIGIKPGQFPDGRQGSIKVNSFVTAATRDGTDEDHLVELKLELEVEIDDHVDATPLSRSIGLIDGRTKMDVCLVFPREQNRRLYASEKVLSDVSPFWKARLSTQGFNESLLESLDLEQEDGYELDSDFGPEPKQTEEEEEEEEHRRNDPLPRGIRVVPILGTSYKTYKALLIWLYTGQIDFSTTTSSRLVSSSPSSRRRRQPQNLLFSCDSNSGPPRVSSRSVYVLSHFLSVPTLSNLALDHFVSLLTLDNAIDVLLSPFVETYDEVREKVLEWILASREDKKEKQVDGEGQKGSKSGGDDSSRWQVLRKSRQVGEWSERMKREGVSQVELEILFKLSGI